MRYFFKKHVRLKKDKDIQLLYQTGKWWNGTHIKIIYLTFGYTENQLTKYGVAVPRKICSKNFQRNKLKRQMREAIRLNRKMLEDKIKPISVFLMMLPKKEVLRVKDVEEEFKLFVNEIKKPMKKKVIVLGKTGQLALCLQDILPSYSEFVEMNFIGRELLDVTDENSWLAFETLFQHSTIDVLINCSAYTAVDKAEDEQEVAMKTNAWAVERMATFAHQKDAEFIHLSTDYVFNGEKTSAYLPTDSIQPLSIYGLSKAIGEQKALQSNPRTIIIRTSWLFSEYRTNFVKTMHRLFKEKEIVGVVNDQFGRPTYAGDLAKAIFDIILHPKREYGIFHYTNKEITSWFDFAIEIFEILLKKQSPLMLKELKPISSAEYPTAAKRPRYSVLDYKKIKKTYSVAIPSWKPALEKVISKLIVAD